MSCWACNKPIQDGQKKCAACGSWQGWRHYLNFSSTTIALFIALLSITATVIALSEKIGPRGVLVSVKSGVAEDYIFQIYNWENYPIQMSKYISCDISGTISVPFVDKGSEYVLPDTEIIEINGGLRPNKIVGIIPPLI